MKILYFVWNGKVAYDLELGIKQFADVKTIRAKNKDYLELMGYNESEFANVKEELEEEQYDAIFTYNYFPMLTKLALKANIKYIAWVYDSPYYPLYDKLAYYSCNYFFIFDALLARETKERNIPNVYHVPLAVNTIRLDTLLGDIRGYTDDITFMGRFYTGEDRAFFESVSQQSDYIAGYLEGLAQGQLKLQGNFSVEEFLSVELLREMEKKLPMKAEQGESELTKSLFFINEIYRYITGVERIEILQGIAKNVGPFSLYSGNIPKGMENIVYKGVADYLIQMPYVFRQSKINLNMTLRSIRSGIPLRCLDIMGSGGFLLSNYQPELAEFFEQGKELVMYHSEAELYHLMTYYLEHDEEREEIARNGHDKVKRAFSFEVQLQKIFEKTF